MAGTNKFSKSYFTLIEKLSSSALFSSQDPSGQRKILLLGTPETHTGGLAAKLRSLNLEHVSPAKLMMREISRCGSAGEVAGRPIPTGKPVSEKVVVAKMRQWFFARKPDAGFLLEGFPATMLQATMFDEWLDARDESLDGVAHCPSGEESAQAKALVEHYRTLGLLIEESPTKTVHA